MVNQKEAKEKVSLVELVMRECELFIAANNEQAKDPKILTGIELVGFISDRAWAIKRQAPVQANAYLGDKSINPTSGLAIGMIEYIAPIVYFHINDEQAEKAPRPEPQSRAHVEYCEDGEAD